MAAESRVRYQAWLRTGCNAFEGKSPHSAPLSFWTEQDILEYIKVKNLDYCKEVYGEIVESGREYLFMGYKTGRPELKTTRNNRTGCMFCMFGCHLEKEPNRFQRMKEDYPKQYDFCMRSISEGGLGCDEVLNYIGCSH